MSAVPSSTPRKWHERNFVSEVVIPTFFTKRKGQHQKPRLLRLKPRELSITWIGHASFLIQTPKQNILIDPNYANWIVGLKRLKRPGLALKDLPPCNPILITHAHFDHLHIPTLRKLAQGQDIIVPENVSGLVNRLKFSNIYEMQHWQTREFGDLKITFVPADHWGARMLADRHRAWGGYIIEYGKRTLYHCGDSAYFEGFKEIGQRFKPEIALLPIGAYEPPSGRRHHMGPEEAVQAFEDPQARWFIPMHYGTFRLSYEPLHEPIERLMKFALKRAVSSKIRILEEGVPEKF